MHKTTRCSGPATETFIRRVEIALDQKEGEKLQVYRWDRLQGFALSSLNSLQAFSSIDIEDRREKKVIKQPAFRFN